eukprot:15364445-Ditylum_brightwellii.AAC.1
MNILNTLIKTELLRLQTKNPCVLFVDDNEEDEEEEKMLRSTLLNFDNDNVHVDYNDAPMSIME